MVKDLKSLDRKLTRTIPERVRRRTRAAMEKGAEEIVAMARALVPEDSGDLKASIGWTWGAAPRGAMTIAESSPADGGERITIYAGNDQAFYARFVEFGTQTMPPHPFFFPSYRTLKRRVKSRITREMKKAIREGAK